jgi:plastocyanin
MPAPPAFVITPDVGPAAGGTPITISGMNLTAGSSVMFGAAPATNVVVVDAMSLTAMTPPGIEGAVDVVVSNPDGHSHTLPGGFTYVAELPPGMPPTITITPAGVTPKAIQVTVGAQVTFVNNDVRNRALQSDPHPLHTDCPELNTLGFMPPGASAQTAVFLMPRTCGFHDHNEPANAGLTGRIVIVPAPPAGPAKAGHYPR